MGRLAIVVAFLVLCASPALAKIDAKGGERGIASTYSIKLVGHATASGQLLDRAGFTAAHKTLPMGTRLVVTNKRNGRKVTVTVNDRGPYYKGRVIDLSPAAASELGMRRAGLAPVEFHVAVEP
jgi:rare lipoprotein A